MINNEKKEFKFFNKNNLINFFKIIFYMFTSLFMYNLFFNNIYMTNFLKIIFSNNFIINYINLFDFLNTLILFILICISVIYIFIILSNIFLDKKILKTFKNIFFIIFIYSFAYISFQIDFYKTNFYDNVKKEELIIKTYQTINDENLNKKINKISNILNKKINKSKNIYLIHTIERESFTIIKNDNIEHLYFDINIDKNINIHNIKYKIDYIKFYIINNKIYISNKDKKFISKEKAIEYLSLVLDNIYNNYNKFKLNLKSWN